MKIVKILQSLLVIAVLTVILSLIYAGVQQSYRTRADEPQVQLARDISSRLKKGKTLDNLVPLQPVDLRLGLAPFVVLYDNAGKPLLSNGMINNGMPTLPKGVFDVAKKNVQYNVTWQPERGVRMAMVLVHTESAPVAYVAAGRSLLPTEKRTSNLKDMLLTGWAICVVLVLIVTWLPFQPGGILNKILHQPLAS